MEHLHFKSRIIYRKPGSLYEMENSSGNIGEDMPVDMIWAQWAD